jgi:glycosyltransferase involved in cell wall biosynthesis
LYARWQAPATKAQEQRCGARAAILLATSERDNELFRSELGLTHGAVIPNGIDLREFTPASASMEPVILFSGLLSYYPNQQGIRWFLNQVFPSVRRIAPQARLVVAGAAPPRWLIARGSADVEVTGAVPDMRPYIRRAGVVIAPLMIGGGTRVKILEAQAMARPVVSTSIGAEGLQQRPDETVVIADDAASFATQIVRLLYRPDEARAMGLRGRSHVVRHYDWDAIGEALRQLLDARLGLRSRVGDERAHRLPSV